MVDLRRLVYVVIIILFEDPFSAGGLLALLIQYRTTFTLFCNF